MHGVNNKETAIISREIIIHHGGVEDAREVRIVSDVGFRWVSQRTNNVDPVAVNPSQTGFTMPVNG